MDGERFKWLCTPFGRSGVNDASLFQSNMWGGRSFQTFSALLSLAYSESKSIVSKVAIMHLSKIPARRQWEYQNAIYSKPKTRMLQMFLNPPLN